MIGACVYRLTLAEMLSPQHRSPHLPAAPSSEHAHQHNHDCRSLSRLSRPYQNEASIRSGLRNSRNAGDCLQLPPCAASECTFNSAGCQVT